MSATSRGSEPIETPAIHTLSNGVRVVCDPMPGLETLALSITVGRGARYESPDQSGWAHLLEHMVFKAAGERTARQVVEVIEAEGGQLNAATGHDRTSFQVRALRGGLPLAMAVVSDLIFRPRLDAADLAKEKRVIAQEIAEAADIPDDLVFELAQEKAFEGQSLGRPILGTKASVAKARAGELAGFRAALYAPDRIVIAASGAVNEAEVLALAEQWFSDPAAAAPPPAPAAPEFIGGVLTKTKRLEQAHLVMLLPALGLRDPDYFALRLFAEILGGGMSSRLFQEVRERLGLCYAIDAYVDAHADAGVLGIYAGTDAGDAGQTARVSAEQMLALIDKVEAGELSRAKAQFKASLFMARESALARAETAAGQLLIFDRLIASAETAAAIEAVQPADLARVGARAVEAGRSACAVLGPAKSMPAAEAFQTALFG
jgi:predicted Zn-dependent peptidase